MVRRLGRSQPNRREVLAGMGVGVATWMAPRWTLAGNVGSVGHADLMMLADRFRRVSRDGIFEEAAKAAAQGADAATLLGAAFVAGVHDIRPRSVGGKLHAVMMVESAFQMAEEGDEREALLAALWSLSDFKRSQD